MCIIRTNIICIRFHPRTGILAESKTDHIPIFLELPKTGNSGLCVSQGERGGVWVNIHCWISIVSTLHPLSYFIFTTSLDSHVYFLPLIAVNQDSERYSHLSKCTQLVKTGQVLILGSTIPEATFHHTTPFKKERYGNVLPSHLSFFPPNENSFSVQIPKVIQQRSFNILWSISHLRWLCSVRKKYFHLLFFPKWRINACYRNAHSTEGFCVLHSAKLWAAAARDTWQTGVQRTPSPPSWNWYPGRRAGQRVLHGGGRGSLAWGRQGGTGPLPKGRETWWRKQRQQAGGAHVTRTDSRQTVSVQRSWDRKGQSLLEERSWAAQGFVNRSGENWKASS